MKDEITVREYLRKNYPERLEELDKHNFKQDLRGFIRSGRNIIRYWIERWSANRR